MNKMYDTIPLIKADDFCKDIADDVKNMVWHI